MHSVCILIRQIKEILFIIFYCFDNMSKILLSVAFSLRYFMFLHLKEDSYIRLVKCDGSLTLEVSMNTIMDRYRQM